MNLIRDINNELRAKEAAEAEEKSKEEANAADEENAAKDSSKSIADYMADIANTSD